MEVSCIYMYLKKMILQFWFKFQKYLQSEIGNGVSGEEQLRKTLALKYKQHIPR